MKKIRFITLLIALIIISVSSFAQFEFIENKGQWNKEILFMGNSGNGAFYLHKQGFTIAMHKQEDFERLSEIIHGHIMDNDNKTISSGKENDQIVLHSHAYKVHFLGGNANVQAIPDKPLPAYNNYFIGNDPSKWAGGCKIYQAITLKDVYPSVDVRYYTDNGRLKYDILAHPGADIKKIRLQYDGPDKLEIKNKELIISTSVGEARELSPSSYQVVNNEKKDVSVKYNLKGNVVSFDVRNYDPSQTLVIDPSIVFSTLSGSTGSNWGYTATYGPDGSFYAGGINLEPQFPVSPGAYQTTFAGGAGSTSNPPSDISLIKYTPTGNARVYATYLGGSNNEQPHSLVVDNQGNLVVVGRTKSNDFPVLTKVGAGGGYDITVTKFNATGTALIGSMRVGGTGTDGVNIKDTRNGATSLLRNYGDDARSEVILDGGGNILMTACTQSDNFPVSGAFQGANAGTQDAVVMKINPSASAMIWSTYMGGKGDDAGFVLTIDPLNSSHIYVSGGTNSGDFPGIGAGVIQNTFAGGDCDGFIAELNDNGNNVSMNRSTYLGTPANDIIYGIQFDRKGFPYVMGTTTGSWPHINAVYYDAGAKQFISKLQPDLSNYVYSTTFGTASSAPNISPVAFLVDNCENVYVSGWGGNINQVDGFPNAGTTGMRTTSDAYRKVSNDGGDFYFFVLQKNAASQLYGSFFGKDKVGSLADHVDGGTSRFDANGVIYQAICADCDAQAPLKGGFPTTPGSWSTSNPSNGCNVASVKIAFNLAGVDVDLKAVGAKQLTFCLPATVEFADTVKKAKKYIWVYDDGTKNDTTITNLVTHTFNSTGYFDVKVYGIDSNTCNEIDSAFLRIKVTTDSAQLGFNFTRQPPCTSLTFDFTNTSVSSGKPFNSGSFAWEWGDGTPADTSFNATHTFPGPGSYNVRLRLIDTAFCNQFDSVQIVNFQVASTIKADFLASDGCVPYNATFKDTSFGAVSWFWDLGDGTTSTDQSPVHLYAAPGTYTIKQVIYNPNSCNLTDSITKTITVHPIPTAAFSFTPNPSQENTPTQFINQSSPDAVSWFWDFGDGATSTMKDPVHQYNKTDTFYTCLVAYNSFGCPDTVCQDVPAFILTLLDVPTAFTPNGDGVNDIVRVRGFGITKMAFRIYNRWGQLVFESRDINTGWDGNFKGQPQPMDAYAFTLDVEFFNGERLIRKGDITLIR